MGCEYIDVEISWSAKLQETVKATKGASQIIAPWHDWSGNMRWDGANVQEEYSRAAELGDIVKIIGKANTVADNFTLQQFASAMTSKPPIAINMGRARQMSRILNTILTPVTHPSLSTKAAPGQLSVAEIQLIDEKIKEILNSPDFGGASVTIPLKLDIVPLLDGVSPAAKLIGAFNTIVVRTAEDGTRTLHGDNTDWMGIAACIKERLLRCTKSLVIGGGGTSRAAIYALHSLGATTIYLYNRTRSTAEKLAKHFPSDYNIIFVDSLETFPSGAPSAIVVPATAISLEPATDKMHITPALLGSKSRGIIVDMAYRLAPTPLIRLARLRFALHLHVTFAWYHSFFSSISLDTRYDHLHFLFEHSCLKAPP
ncbi:hypothetical protein M422DRAFT_270838 [Sphaerobolus stellatus SS14]|uniref:Shikimate dehydrogenase n=1 Tax=Sphaerobolus stellatus (strain SS14) TaxID=990650 RepID=A0A0C9URS7_SPHS4|nr:hypothetical protein M422DRAFT_270838 [Sphaerobolus stellatus SS14]